MSKEKDEIIIRQNRIGNWDKSKLGSISPRQALIRLFSKRVAPSQFKDLGIHDYTDEELASAVLNLYESFFQEYDERTAEWRLVRAELDIAAVELAKLKGQMAECIRTEEKYKSLTAVYDELKASVDHEEIELKILYAVDQRTKTITAESESIKQQLAIAQSEIQELKRSKKRLREALDRLKDKI